MISLAYACVWVSVCAINAYPNTNTPYIIHTHTHPYAETHVTRIHETLRVRFDAVAVVAVY